MFEQVVVRCQFLSVLVNRRPASPDSISDFGRLQLLESNHLAQVFRAFSSCQYFDFHVIDFNFLSCVLASVAKNFRLSWMDPESHFFSTPLEFAQHVLKLFFGGCNVCDSVMVVVTQVNSQTFFLLPARNVVFQCSL